MSSSVPVPEVTATEAAPDAATDAASAAPEVQVDVPEALQFEATLLADGESFDGATLAAE